MRKEKISVGIITYHEPYSYGADLQCLGLQLFLEELGCKAEVIDYSMNAYLELRSKRKLRSLYQRMARFMWNPSGFIKAKRNAVNIAEKSADFQKQLEERNRKFREFQNKYYHTSSKRYERYSELKNDPPIYDAYICGSDQIWNPFFCDMDDNYFLAFAPKGRRIAYAPSIGVQKFPNYARKEYKKRLKEIDALSVREKTGAKIVKELIGQDVPVVIDPTFLITGERWSKLADDSDLVLPVEYMLTYFIGIDEHIQNFIECVKEAFPQYQIINLVFDQSSYGPCDFIKLISQAQFVFTNSFHGLAFCINLNVPFAVGRTLKDYGSGSAFSRIEDLLENLELSDRIYDGTVRLDTSWLTLDFSEANRKRKELVLQSKEFLEEALWTL
jgi:hypothetical protein